MAAILGGAQNNKKVAVYAHEKVSLLKHSIEKDREYIYANGKGTFAPVVSLVTLLTLFLDRDGVFAVPSFK